MADVPADVPADVTPANIPLRRPRRALVHPRSKRRIRIRHPGYSQYRGSEDLLFQFAALDHVDDELSSREGSRDGIWGAYYGTIITACGIITNNAFDQVYLSKDVYGKDHATPHRGILEHGNYWLQLRGRELPGPQDQTSTRHGDKFYQYPIVPSFSNWSFPHGQLPAEWQQPHNPPPTDLPPSDNKEEKEQDEEEEEEVDGCCYVANLRIGIEKAHLVPTAHNVWMNQNEMDQYCDEPTSSPVHSKRNIISLMACLHTVFDSGAFVIVPKPWVRSPTSGPLSSASASASASTTISPSTTTNSQPSVDGQPVVDPAPAANPTSTPKPTSTTNGQSNVDIQPIISPAPTTNPTSIANPTSITHPASTVEPQLYAFAVHVLSFHPDAKDFGKLYHNVTIQPKYLGKIARECLFARFAWAVFPFLNNFLCLSTVPRRLVIISGNGTKDITAKPGQFKAMEKDRKASASSSRKRARGSGDENAALDDEDDAYEERWRRRSGSRERWLSEYAHEDRHRGRSRYRDLSPESDIVPGLTDSFSTDASYENRAWIDLPEQESQAREDQSGPKNSAPLHSDLTNVI
ncbi:hypothetical protein F5X98DRAFT_359112 [Xylaria grammica]|nr:hypothetical protein F5X98DRAFT_359112 [Xylaria grammica]